MLWTVIHLIALAALAVVVAVLLYERHENRRLRTQNAEMQQLVADAAAQATIDQERNEELVQQIFRRKESAS